MTREETALFVEAAGRRVQDATGARAVVVVASFVDPQRRGTMVMGNVPEELLDRLEAFLKSLPPQLLQGGGP